MNESNMNQDRIEAYLLGELDARENKQFERELDQDPALQQAVSDFQELQSDLQIADEALFLEEMQAIHAEIREPAPSSAPRQRRWWLIAASILLLLIPALLFFPRSASGPDQLYAEYFSPLPDYTNSRASDDPDFLNAMSAYQSGDYASARPLFSAFLQRVPDDLDANLYGGITELEVGEPQIALRRLEKVSETDNIFSSAASWFQALAHVKMEAYEKARPLLETLSGTPNDFQEEAKNLLRDLPD